MTGFCIHCGAGAVVSGICAACGKRQTESGVRAPKVKRCKHRKTAKQQAGFGGIVRELTLCVGCGAVVGEEVP